MTYGPSVQAKTRDNYFSITVVYYYTGDKISTNDDEAAQPERKERLSFFKPTQNLTSYFYF